MLLVAGWSLLLGAWAWSNPPGSSPDETAHLVKALGVAGGDLVGRPAAYKPGPEFGEGQLRWINSVTRAFDVPRAKTFGTIATCNAFRPAQSAACLPDQLGRRARPPEATSLELTHVGPYQPLPYAALGVPARLAPGGAAAALLAGRLVTAAITVGLLALAVAALWSAAAGVWSLLGIVVAVSPMVVFLGSSFSPSGMEVAGGVCMAAGVVAVARTAAPRRRAWAALGAGGTVMALARTTGPYWALALLLVLLLITGLAGLRGRMGGRRGWATVALVAIGAGAAATVGWDLAVMPGPSGEVDLVDGALRAGSDLPELMRQAIGVFGWLDTAMPTAAYTAWRLMLAGLVGLALLVGTRRDRGVLGLSIAGVLVATIGLAVFAVYPNQFGTQARYTLPLAMVVPVLAGEIVSRRRHRLAAALPRNLPLLVGATAAGVHLLGFWSNARRQAVGVEGPVFFVGRSEWSPFIGWSLWLTLALVACGLLAAALRSPARPAPDPIARTVGQPGG